MKIIQRKIVLEAIADRPVKLSEITKRNYALVILYTERPFSRQFDKNCILYIIVSAKKKIYGPIYGGYDGYNNDKTFGDGMGEISDMSDEFDRNSIHIDEDILNLNMADDEHEKLVNYMTKFKPFKNIEVDYNPDGEKMKGYFTSIAQFELGKVKFEDDKITGVTVKKHYYKPILPFSKMYEVDINEDNVKIKFE